MPPPERRQARSSYRASSWCVRRRDLQQGERGRNKPTCIDDLACGSHAHLALDHEVGDYAPDV
eukprot:scaffold1233_cov395-Prasinococcus_capsulatus_cf.AAC.46